MEGAVTSHKRAVQSKVVRMMVGAVSKMRRCSKPTLLER
jgi:hypothetical protein